MMKINELSDEQLLAAHAARTLPFDLLMGELARRRLPIPPVAKSE
jgi:hypothetical protein